MVGLRLADETTRYLISVVAVEGYRNRIDAALPFECSLRKKLPRRAVFRGQTIHVVVSALRHRIGRYRRYDDREGLVRIARQRRKRHRCREITDDRDDGRVGSRDVDVRLRDALIVAIVQRPACPRM